MSADAVSERTIAIANPRAGRGRVARDRSEIERQLRERFALDTFHVTTHAGHATELAREATAAKAGRVVAVGGDGLINEVVNGLCCADDTGNANTRPCLTACPVGSGNDFVKSLGYRGVWPTPLPDLVDAVCDVGHIELRSATGSAQIRYFLNVASAGSSAVIADHANRIPGFVPAKLRYRVATVMGLAGFDNPRVRLSIGDDTPTERVISMIAVANGTTFGAGMKVAPDAQLDDGHLRVVIVGDVGLLAFARHGGALDRGDHVGLPFVETHSARAVTVTPLDASTPIWVEADGERAGQLPATFSVRPGALRVSRAC